jgi:hypothetical protein
MPKPEERATGSPIPAFATLGPSREIKLSENTRFRFGAQVQAWAKAGQDRILQPDGSDGGYAFEGIRGTNGFLDAISPLPSTSAEPPSSTGGFHLGLTPDPLVLVLWRRHQGRGPMKTVRLHDGQRGSFFSYPVGSSHPRDRQ